MDELTVIAIMLEERLIHYSIICDTEFVTHVYPVLTVIYLAGSWMMADTGVIIQQGGNYL